MNRVVILQVRMGSSRLPGKAMLPLAGEPALAHEIRRAATADPIDVSDVVVATSTRPRDDVLKVTAERTGATVYRGSESDVLGRVRGAVESVDADAAVRLCGDNTLIDPRLVEVLFETLDEESVDYVSTKFERTFPIGHNADAFTADAIARAADRAVQACYREHIARYFKDEPERIDWHNVTADEVFDPELRKAVPGFTDLRLTMDECDDYELLRQIHDGVAFEEVLDTGEAIRYVLENDLRSINDDVTQEVW
jgi:spore coat polysaccharide biosynthesis protein SpsF